MSASPAVIELTEYAPQLLPREAISEADAARLWDRHAKLIELDYPSPKTNGQWRIMAQGAVGHLPISPALGIRLRTKTPVGNLFRMLEYAYGLKSFTFLEDRTDYTSLEDVYERLASVLARRVLDRIRKGLYRTYVAHSDSLPFIRERLDIAHAVRRPWSIQPRCEFHEHTADMADNQILSWTLETILRCGLVRTDVRELVRRAARDLQSFTTLTPCRASDCVGRTYTRLNEDYALLHALCRFFLEHTGPALDRGVYHMQPFTLNTADLFESFVAAWLRRHLPPAYRFTAQEQVHFENKTYFKIDLVLYHQGDAGSAPRMVMDTKYKVPTEPSSSDIHQIVAYAVSRGCKEAVLIYPAPIPNPFTGSVGDVRVRSLVFDLSGDLEAAGRRFLGDLAG